MDSAAVCASGPCRRPPPPLSSAICCCQRQALGRLTALIDRHRPSKVLCVNAYALMYAHLARRHATVKPAIVDILHTTLVRTWKERLQMLVYRPFFWMWTMAATDDIALSICFLLSDWSRHITGEILNINGGAVLCG